MPSSSIQRNAREPDASAATSLCGSLRSPNTIASAGQIWTPFASVRFEAGDAFVFGAETRGLPQALLDWFPAERTLRLPMRPGNRSLNLSNAVAVVVFEAWRQQGFPGSA